MSLRKYSEHYNDTLKLAIPVVIASAGQMLTQIADNIMIGHVDTVSLAGASFAHNVFVIFLVAGIGFAQGITPLVGQAFGKGDYSLTGWWLKHGFLLNMIAAIILFLTLLLAEPVMYHLGQEVIVVEKGLVYFRILNYTMFPLMLFFTFKQFAEGVGSTKVAMSITLIANGLNIFLNWLLIYGNWGFPRMELAGAGWATLISRTIMALTMGVYVLSNHRFRPFIEAFFKKGWSRGAIISLLKLNIPIGLQHVMEVAAFAIGAILVGRIGAVEQAAHQIAIGLVSLTFMITAGISSAVTIRTSNFVGANNYRGARYVAWSGLHMAVIFMFFAAIFLLLFPEWMAGVHTRDQKVIEVAVPMLFIASLFQLFDGTQVVAFGALRGIADVKIPTGIAFVSHWLISLPIGYYLAFYTPFRELGIWYGFLAGLGAASILLILRFHFITKAHRI